MATTGPTPFTKEEITKFEPLIQDISEGKKDLRAAAMAVGRTDFPRFKEYYKARQTLSQAQFQIDERREAVEAQRAILNQLDAQRQTATAFIAQAESEVEASRSALAAKLVTAFK